VGLAIQGSVDVAEFVSAVDQEDDQLLTIFSGVGKKTASQIILDLKGKLTSMLSLTNQPEIETSGNQPNTAILKEAQEALKALGYTEREIKAILPQLQKDTSDNIDELIRKALALLMKNKQD